MSTALRAALPLLLALSAGTAAAQTIPLPGGTYTQDFDTLSNTAGSTTNSNLPTGWLINETGGGARDNELYAVDTGASNTGDTYSYGAAASTERALGSLRSGTLLSTFGACFTNGTGGPLTSVDIAYTGEQWRLGTAARTDQLVFEISTNATSLTTGTWTAVAALQFTTPNTATVGAKDGNAAGNRTALSATVPASIANGATFCVRWVDTDASSADDGLAIDDFSITVGASAPAPDYAVSIEATPASVQQGGQVVVRTRFANLGTLDLAEVESSQTVPAGVDFVSRQLENAVGTVSGDCSTGTSPVTCAFTLAAGASIELVSTYAVQANAVGPLEFVVTGSPPAEDADPGNNSDSASVGVVRLVRIPEIQGAGIGSPLPLGTEVITEGVVTARRSNGYFIQSFRHDGNAATAEGLFVFTSSAPPANAAVGNLVRVTGRVNEFRRTPHGYPLTQLTNSSLVVVRTGVPLPTAAGIGGFLVPGFPVSELGRFQGMRVKIVTADVVGPTNGFGDFYITRSHIPRPVREPGIAVLDTVPLPVDNTIPRFDRNPERLRVESAGLEGLTPVYFDAGTRLTNLTGIMYYDRGDFTLLLDNPNSLTASGGALPAAVPATEPGSLRIGSYNIENLSGGASIDLGRLQKLTDVFCGYLRTPDIVGLVEIANLETAQRLAQAINDDEFGNCPRNPQYVAYLLSTSGSQRLGYLVSTAPTDGGTPRVQVLSVEERFVGETLTNPLGNPDNLLFDRPPLYLQARVTGENGEPYDVDVVLNHTLSLLDVVDLTPRAVWGTNGDRSRAKRAQQAVRLSQLVQEIQQADPDQPLVLIGDYNAYDFSDGYVDVMGIISGTPAAPGTVLVHADSAVTMPLTNLLGTKAPAQRYSYVFEGNTQSIDHALVNNAVLATAEATLHHARVNADFAADNAADPSVPLRSSDHDPLVVDLQVPTFLDADLSLAASARRATVQSPYIANFDLVVSNQGPMRAIRPELELVLDVPPARVVRARGLGWLCGVPVADGAGSRVFCARGVDMDPGASDAFLIQVQTATEASVSVQGVVATRSVDTDPTDDTAAATATVLPPR